MCKEDGIENKKEILRQKKIVYFSLKKTCCTISAVNISSYIPKKNKRRYHFMPTVHKSSERKEGKRQELCTYYTA